MKQYSTIFFDLDHTLWDFKTNSRNSLLEIIAEYDLEKKGDFIIDNFLKIYFEVNNKLWDLYRHGLIEKEILRYKRFRDSLIGFNITDEVLIKNISDDYVFRSPLKTALFPNTIEILNYLQAKYSLHIITNGFDEVQLQKMKSSNIEKYFTHVITSEMVGVKKPHKQIFEYALNKANASPEKCLMIGDTLDVDIEGARNMGIDQVFFNTEEKIHNEDVTHEIKDLIELKEFL